MATLDVYWYDHQLDINWFARADSARAFRLVTFIVESFGDGVISADLGPAWSPHELCVHGLAPFRVAALIETLFANETQCNGTLESGGRTFMLRAHAGEGGGAAVLDASDRLFGAELEKVAALLRRFSETEGVPMLAPLQPWLFGEIPPPDA